MSGHISRAFGKRSSQKPAVPPNSKLEEIKKANSPATRRRSASNVDFRPSTPPPEERLRSPLQFQLSEELGQKLPKRIQVSPSTAAGPLSPPSERRNMNPARCPSPNLRGHRGRGRGGPHPRGARGRGRGNMRGTQSASGPFPGASTQVKPLPKKPDTPIPSKPDTPIPSKPETPLPMVPKVSQLLKGNSPTPPPVVPRNKPQLPPPVAPRNSPKILHAIKKNSAANLTDLVTKQPTSPQLIQRADANKQPSVSPQAETKRNLWRILRSMNATELASCLRNNNTDFVDSYDLDGDTPLSFAVQNTNLELVRVLLENGATASKATTKGPEPLHIACEKGDIAISQLLLDYNACIDSRNAHSDKTPLHYASGSKNVKIVEWAILNGADISYKNRFGISPIYVAVSVGSEPSVRTLLQHGADPNCLFDGHTLLHLACMYGFFRIGCLLIRSGANVNALNNERKTPLELMKVNPNVDDGFGSDGKSPIAGFLRWIFLYACTADDSIYINAVLRDAPQHFTLQRSAESYCSVSPLSEAVTTIGSMKVATCLIEYGAPVKVPEENLPRAIFDKNHTEAIRAVCKSLLGSVGGSKKKKKLDLSNCNLHCLPEEVVEVLCTEEEFKQIRTLDLSHNVLRGLPPNLLNLPNLEKLKVEGNPLDMIPETFRKTLSWVKIREYLKTVRVRAQKWQTCKLLVVGQEGVGKTTLIRSLQSKHGKTQCKQNVATDGVDIKSMNISSSDGAGDGGDVNLMVWDLGGQEVFYPTHQFYLTANSMYIIAFDMAKISNKKNIDSSSFEEIESRISYWAYQIRELTSGQRMPPIFLVGTHADQVQPQPGQSKEECIESQIEILRLKFPKQRFPGIVDIVAVSCKNGDGVQELRTQICQSVKKKGFLPEVSESWVKLHDFIQSAVVDTDTTSRSVLNDWARMCGVREEQIDMACQFLRDMGTLLLFNGEGLENLVIMNPRWLTNVMASLITFRHTWVKAGTLPIQDVPQVFKHYPKELHETLLNLLEQFSIIFHIHSEEKQEILVPSLLPEDCRASVLAKEWPQRQKSQTEEYGRIYRFPFLPLGFFGRIMVRVLHLPGVQGNLYWRYGMVIEYTNPNVSQLFKNRKVPAVQSRNTPRHLALLEYDPVQFQFSIRVRIPKIEVGRNMLLQTLVDCVDTTLEEYCMRECAERLIPCTHCMDSDSSSSLLDSKSIAPFLFSFAECIIAVTEQGGHVFCNHIRSPSRQVQVDRLAPDIALSGIPLIDEKQLKIGDVLGRGGFGVVYRAEFQQLTTVGRYQPQRKTRTRASQRKNPLKNTSTTQVAVKELHCEDKVELAMMYADFQAEVYVMSQMRRHPNIVRLHGVCLFPKPRMVLELLPLGDLHGFLHPKNPKEPENLQTFIPPREFSWKMRLLMALDIAKGMFVLHSQTPAIIHRDLRSPNIFLSSLDENASVRAKVADFGLARIVAPTVSGTLNTWQWLAPEVLGMTGNSSNSSKSAVYGISSDVYSFAICCWEIATGGFPFDEFNNDPRFQTANSNEISVTTLKEAIAKGLRPTLFPPTGNEPPIEGRTIPAAFHSLIQDCWATEPQIRPTFAEILDRLIDMTSLNQKQLAAATNLQNIRRTLKPERSSCRLTIDFTPMQLNNILQQTKLEVKYHTEYNAIQKFITPGKGIPACAALFDDVLSESPSIWVGYVSGHLSVLNTSQKKVTTQNLTIHERPIQSILATDQQTIWVCGKDGKMMIWDPKTCELIREWNLRKNVALAMVSMRSSSDEQQIWVASPHCIHIYSDEQLLHILNVSKKQEIRAIVQHANLAWVAVGNEIFVYDIDTLDMMGSWEAFKGAVDALESVGTNFVWSSSAREIAIWKVNDMEIFCCKKLSIDGDCKYMKFSAMDNRVWTGIGNNIIIWDPVKHQPLQEIAGEGGGDEIIVLLKSNFTDLLFTLTRCESLTSWSIN